jgi:hypothetical protein
MPTAYLDAGSDVREPRADEVTVRYRHRPTARSPILYRKLPGPNC